MIDKLHPFECVDEWKKDSLTPVKLAAYKWLIADDTIEVEKVYYKKGDTTILYNSAHSHGETLKILSDAVRILEEYKSPDVLC